MGVISAFTTNKGSTPGAIHLARRVLQLAILAEGRACVCIIKLCDAVLTTSVSCVCDCAGGAIAAGCIAEIAGLSLCTKEEALTALLLHLPSCRVSTSTFSPISISFRIIIPTVVDAVA